MGRVRLGYLDPSQIHQVVPDPENAAILIGIETKGVSGRKRRYPIILEAEEWTMLSGAAQTLRLSFTDNPCFFFTINRVTNATRGSSDLLRKLDWLQAYEEWMFNRLEWSQQVGAFIWDVLLKGMNSEQIQKWLDENPPPKPNSIRAHNEAVEWQAVAPDLKSVDLKEAARLFRNHILMDDGWPEAWFVEGGETNRATLGEQGDPIVKSITARQKKVQGMLHAMIRYALRKRVEAGSLPRTVIVGEGESRKTLAPWEALKISTPEIASRDFSRLGGVIVQISQALIIAKSNGWITHDDAAGLFALIASMFGREVEAAPAPEEPAVPGGEDFTPEQIANIRDLFNQVRSGNGGRSAEREAQSAGV
jgi:hypothetical protein